MAKIIAPNEKYNDRIANVQFTNGVGETTDSSLIEWFREKGYTIEGEEKKINYNKMNVEELQELAKEKGIAGYEEMKKEDLIKALKE